MIFWLFLVILYAHLIEYIVHRWFMHYPLLGKPYWYLNHHIEHHGKKRNDINIEMPFHVSFLGLLPWFLGCIWFGWTWFFILVFLGVAYSLTWTLLHHTHHDLNDYAYYFPFYSFWRHHHLMHHKYPNKNFGAVFPWTDLLFGTNKW